MKKIKVLLSLLAVAFALPVVAQQYAANAVSVNNTNLNGGNTSTQTIAAASANIYNATIPLTKYDGTSIQLTAKLMGAGTSAITAMIDASNDGSNWVSPYTYITVNANGTTAVNSGTNLVSQHWGYLRLAYVTNASNVVLTNLSVTYTTKPKRNG